MVGNCIILLSQARAQHTSDHVQCTEYEDNVNDTQNQAVGMPCIARILILYFCYGHFINFMYTLGCNLAIAR